MDKLEGLKFDERGLIPAIVQDVDTKEVLMLAYMNEDSLRKTLDTGETWFWSRSRKELWHKGETSGHIQKVKSINYDCDGDTLLIEAEQKGVACHTGARSCFFNLLYLFEEDREEKATPDIIEKLYKIITDRKENPRKDSYTNYLLDEGLDKILKKVGEETAEVIIAAKNPDRNELIYETGDLLYHLLVLLRERDIAPREIFAELGNRFK
ncbi:MAG: bifunctional phosphoribosyl-AMP cyclohydrolase/phosphoribosyl-ATP diphosphatase HisIE [Natronincolaceae bacterium]|jgi:phosphoribosyl-ATP pyrophosphohydrolase/phosphoribosyl-AMP cyclohydrolase|nr:bifunctional phosphoribosyl-AMP cyclohydrolase/phosphoribosyl-ATP diphosphatase HisIE [Bacillota bacterium]NLK91393.1 bifunctional phosphoribosyl-AMP cyclohydrolase/phosphoribosyl-ATP diphosphatase HisIE [Clostridiales bacterium]